MPPFGRLKFQHKSWINDRLPELLWATLYVSEFPRQEALGRFFRAVEQVAELTKGMDEFLKDHPAPVLHSSIGQLDRALQVKVIAAICPDERSRLVLRPLLLLEGLPAHEAWLNVLGGEMQASDWQTLAKAVGLSSWHQSQEATDCRWVSLMSSVYSGRVRFQVGMEDTIRLLAEYATLSEEELREARPTVRSIELVFDKTDQRPQWPQVFWANCFSSTKCMLPEIDADYFQRKLPTKEQLEADRKLISKLNQDLTDHFWESLHDSDVDPRHEVSFGLALYAVDLVTTAIALGLGRAAQGRMTLRSLVECLISLTHLKSTDDPEDWQAFRVHGQGQAKLVVQRSEEQKRCPGYLDESALGELANDDVWVEFLPVQLGHWDASNLRKMAEKVRLKDMYDDYYTWPSSYAHGQWGAIRELCYQKCGNPLHRFHLIPRLVCLNLVDCHDDFLLLLQRILDVLNELYPRESREEATPER